MTTSNKPNKNTTGNWVPLDIGKPSTVDYVIEGSTIVLNALKNAGSMTSVPFLSEAAGMALRILTMAQDVRGNKDAFVELGRDACGLVYAVLVECQNIVTSGRKVPDRLQEHIRQLVENLRTIEKFTDKKVDRGYVARVIQHSKDKDQIDQYKVMLRQSLDLFGLQSSITIQDNVQRVLIAVETQREELRLERLQRQKEEEERRTQAEIQRIQEEDERVARLQEDERRRKENERLKKRLEKEKRRRQREEERRRASDIEIESESEEEPRQPSRRPSPQPLQYAHPHVYHPSPSPVPVAMGAYPSPYAPSPYMLAPPTTSFGPISMNNISGSAISLGGTTQNAVHNFNSGNVTNVEMSNMNNDNSIRYGPPRSRSRSPRLQ